MSSDYNDPNNREYSNGEISVFWQPGKCIHATTCYKELIEVFNPRKRPWVNMNGASSERIIDVVKMCPTDALTYKYNKDGEHKQSAGKRERPVKGEGDNDVPTTIRVMKGGPLIVKGNFKITGPDGNEINTMKMVSFCRCGHSGKMPFCDGTHSKINFSG